MIARNDAIYQKTEFNTAVERKKLPRRNFTEFMEDQHKHSATQQAYLKKRTAENEAAEVAKCMAAPIINKVFYISEII